MASLGTFFKLDRNFCETFFIYFKKKTFRSENGVVADAETKVLIGN